MITTRAMTAMTTTKTNNKSHLWLVLILAVAMMAALPLLTEKASATSYPVMKDTHHEGTYALLSGTYEFDYSGNPSGSRSDNWGQILRYNSTYNEWVTVATLRLGEYDRMYCIGKYGGKFYFNVSSTVEAKGVYTYKLGDTKFRRVAKGINLHYFKKSYGQKSNQRKLGIMKKRYVLAVKNYPTDVGDGCGKMYVYDLKKNKKKSLGHVFDYIKIGKKIYWVTVTPRNWYNSSKSKILVKKSNLSGGKIKTVKKYKAKFLKGSYGAGTITKHYVKWSYMKWANGDSSYKTFRKKYR